VCVYCDFGGNSAIRVNKKVVASDPGSDERGENEALPSERIIQHRIHGSKRLHHLNILRCSASKTLHAAEPCRCCANFSVVMASCLSCWLTSHTRNTTAAHNIARHPLLFDVWCFTLIRNPQTVPCPAWHALHTQPCLQNPAGSA
jgi:hypothetical protein